MTPLKTRTRRRKLSAAGVSVCALALLAGACATSVVPRTKVDETVAWPASEPRVRLIRLVEHRKGRGASALSRAVTGKRLESMFERPYAVAWAGQDLLVSDPAARRVSRINPRGRSIHSEPGLFVSPIGIAACGTEILVSDSILGKVALLDRDLGLRRWIAEGLERPTGVDCHGGRYFIVETARHRILALDPENQPSGRNDAPPAAPTATLAFGPAGESEPVQLHDSDRVLRILGQRGETEGSFNFPTVVRAGARSLWVGDSLNFRLQEFDVASGRFLRSFGALGDAPGEMPRVKGIAIDSRADVWVSDAYLDQVALYRQDGTFLMAIGGHGIEGGRFSFPAGIAAHPDGRVAVVDSLNRRVQIFGTIDSEHSEGARP